MLRPHHSNYSVEQAATLFHLDDFRPVLGDHFSNRSYNDRNSHRISLPRCDLTFKMVNIWEKFRIQQHSVHDPRVVAPAQTVQAAPPSPTLPFGRANTVLIAHESGDLLSADPQAECEFYLQLAEW